MAFRSLAAAWVLCGALPAAGAFQLAPAEQPFVDLLDKEHHPLEAREAAKAYLAGHPDSFIACEVIGIVYLNTDGDLPRALYYFTRARTLLERRWVSWGPDSPAGYYSATLYFLYTTQYRMERYEDALATLRKRDSTFLQKYPSGHSWPLMKLGRDREARDKIQEALGTGDLEETETALNTLGALDAEADRPEEAFATEMRLYDLAHGQGPNVDCAFIRNAGEGALALGLMSRAEQLFLEATGQFTRGTVSNPWGDLASFYLVEQRFSEAMDAVKNMHRWASRSTPLTAQTNWNLRQTLTGGLLLYCGCTEEALVISRRLVERPDRHATGSARDGQREAGTQLFHCMAIQEALARDGEEASFAPWSRRPGILLRRARHALEAALARRRTGSLLMDTRDRMSQTLRVLGPQSVVLVPGGEALLPGILGPGVVEAEVRRLLARTGSAALRERGFLLFSLGAARMERGDARGALAALQEAEALLPAEYALLHTQLQALRAKAFLSQGDAAGALPALVAVMARDGGEVRRAGLALPCRVQASPGPMPALAAKLLGASPRLAPGRGGFRVVVEQTPQGGLAGGLDDPQGNVLSRFQVPPAKDADATAREFCRQFHLKAFGPRIDLSQQQIRSLEGSTLASQSAEEQLKGILGK